MKLAAGYQIPDGHSHRQSIDGVPVDLSVAPGHYLDKLFADKKLPFLKKTEELPAVNKPPVT